MSILSKYYHLKVPIPIARLPEMPPLSNLEQMSRYINSNLLAPKLNCFQLYRPYRLQKLQLVSAINYYHICILKNTGSQKVNFLHPSLITIFDAWLEKVERMYLSFDFMIGILASKLNCKSYRRSKLRIRFSFFLINHIGSPSCN